MQLRHLQKYLAMDYTFNGNFLLFTSFLVICFFLPEILLFGNLIEKVCASLLVLNLGKHSYMMWMSLSHYINYFNWWIFTLSTLVAVRTIFFARYLELKYVQKLLWHFWLEFEFIILYLDNNLYPSILIINRLIYPYNFYSRFSIMLS